MEVSSNFTPRRQPSNSLPTFSLPQNNAMLAPHFSNQPRTAPGAASQVAIDPYAHSRPPSSPSFYASSNAQQSNYYTTSNAPQQAAYPSSASQPSSYYTTSTNQQQSGYHPSSTTPQQSSFPATTPQQSSFPSYASHGSASPTGTDHGSRMGSISGPHGGMAPPQPSYGRYGGYPQMSPTLGGPVMSNIHQPGAQMSVMPGMGMPAGYPGHGMMYGHHGQPQPQSERPFKCDQCTQSFSRNHDLKRHKRIHLAVKPFPCNYCSKSFSRKDALKRHRLVKGCENKASENAAGGERPDADRAADADDARSPTTKDP
ncbi:hypothetical protein DCS_01045 [Drechmeria coniospora]|uniref:C2H2-type domain-containing protein n=1 Tax=Drechmeria coniospora TaxID=98403 RepID=A0A151GS69_DRECN|nr:hypothetical protein DCS_01045 [Drechmeria coniospora]KYK59911.1 hypothetical protein DCS_01045 [Drechmeria coniospora]ODA78709.1 hypothetical protein RJ55_06091 [Drechmeria coniospora]